MKFGNLRYNLVSTDRYQQKICKKHTNNIIQRMFITHTLYYYIYCKTILYSKLVKFF